VPPDLQTADAPPSVSLVDRLKRFVLAFREVCQGYMLPSPGC
jgi:hypothetical protein